ncbi:hypothetical protein ACFL23_00605 [Patescibacteria group bacterium]
MFEDLKQQNKVDGATAHGSDSSVSSDKDMAGEADKHNDDNKVPELSDATTSANEVDMHRLAHTGNIEKNDKVEDIFEKIKDGDNVQESKSQIPVLKEVNEKKQEIEDEKDGKRIKKRIFFIVLIVVIIVGAILLLLFLNRNIDFAVEDATPALPVSKTGGRESTRMMEEELEGEEWVDDEWEDEIIDTDGDGLSDNDEMNLGTSVFQIDTDEDGLSDREEIEVYKTDPLNSDTDGDMYLDGNEIEKGYNPKGEGLLLNL